MNHDNRVGPRNKRVNLDEFLDYYNFVSMGIEDDLYFITMVQNEWKINPYYYSKVISKQQQNWRYCPHFFFNACFLNKFYIEKVQTNISLKALILEQCSGLGWVDLMK